jgi:hypothetical protein
VKVILVKVVPSDSGESESESFGRLSARESDYVRDQAKATGTGQSCMPVSSDAG